MAMTCRQIPRRSRERSASCRNCRAISVAARSGTRRGATASPHDHQNQPVPTMIRMSASRGQVTTSDALSPLHHGGEFLGSLKPIFELLEAGDVGGDSFCTPSSLPLAQSMSGTSHRS